MPQRRLEVDVILSIFRWRVHGLSIDKICDQLESAFGRSFGRGTVAKYVRHYDSICGEIRDRDLPFRWNQLEKANVPWEASEWLRDCQWFHESVWIRAVDEAGNSMADADFERFLEIPQEPFTNRWARWCWRVHVLAVDILEAQVLALARLYAHNEAIRDVIPDYPVIEMNWLDQWLRYRPDLNGGGFYGAALDLGLVEPIPEPKPLLQEQKTWALWGLDTYGAAGSAIGIHRFLTRWNERSEAGDARTTEATEQGQLDDHLGRRP